MIDDILIRIGHGTALEKWGGPAAYLFNLTQIELYYAINIDSFNVNDIIICH